MIHSQPPYVINKKSLLLITLLNYIKTFAEMQLQLKLSLKRKEAGYKRLKILYLQIKTEVVLQDGCIQEKQEEKKLCSSAHWWRRKMSRYIFQIHLDISGTKIEVEERK